MRASNTCRGLPTWKLLISPARQYPRPVSQNCRKQFPNYESTFEQELTMNSRLRMCLLVSLGVAGWLTFTPGKAQAQNGEIARAAVNQYLNGAYSGYGYQPQYYGSYGYQPRYYGGYGNGYGYSYGNA